MSKTNFDQLFKILHTPIPIDELAPQNQQPKTVIGIDFGDSIPINTKQNQR
jgi:hypothetical protein